MLRFAQRSSVLTRLQCKGSVIILSVLWSFGLICGLYFVSSESELLSSIAKDAAFTRQSIFGFFAVIYIPIVISGISIYFSVPAVIYIYSIFKAFCISCSLCSIAVAFGDSTWLVRMLLLFSDTSSVILMLWLWFRCLHLDPYIVRKDFLLSTLFLTAIGLVDYFLVSPYLVLLMNYS